MPKDILFFYYNPIVGFLIGACLGSFLNVVMYRWPAGKSVVHPPSHCPACGTPIKSYDNIPVLSWFILRGKCRACGASFSVRYALVEAFYGSVWALCTVVFSGQVLLGVGTAILLTALIPAVVMLGKHRKAPIALGVCCLVGVGVQLSQLLLG